MTAPQRPPHQGDLGAISSGRGADATNPRIAPAAARCVHSETPSTIGERVARRRRFLEAFLNGRASRPAPRAVLAALRQDLGHGRRQQSWVETKFVGPTTIRRGGGAPRPSGHARYKFRRRGPAVRGSVVWARATRCARDDERFYDTAALPSEWWPRRGLLEAHAAKRITSHSPLPYRHGPISASLRPTTPPTPQPPSSLELLGLEVGPCRWRGGGYKSSCGL